MTNRLVKNSHESGMLTLRYSSTMSILHYDFSYDRCFYCTGQCFRIRLKISS